MKFGIIWSDNSLKQLRKLERHVAKRIVDGLDENPYRSVKKVIGDDSFKFRVGDYSVFMDIRNSELQIEIVKIKHRRVLMKNSRGKAVL